MRVTNVQPGLMSRRLAVAGLMAAPIAGLVGCGGPGSNLPRLPDVDTNVYTLGPGDQIRIITFGEQQLTGEFRVDAAGEIALPLVGDVHAAGLTAKQLEAAVAQTLTRSKLYKNPSVSVEVINYRPIFILGEVSRPGQYPYQPAMTVVTAVAVSGGFTYRAVTDRFSIVRTSTSNRQTSIEGVAGRATFVQPGDVITVFERVF
jgi:polysaccharide export outer membrane protein